MNILYLDNAATTQVASEVVQAMKPYWSMEYGNPSSRFHAFGWAAEEAVSQSRQTLARFLGAFPDEVVFTSGASEALQLIFMAWHDQGGRHVVVPTTEHSIVLDLARWASNQGKNVQYWPVDFQGNLKEKMTFDSTPDLVLIMWGNNEIGTYHDIKRRVQQIKSQFPTCWVGSDATQAIGKIPIDFQETGLDFLVGSAHKLHGPKGIGFLCIRRGLEFFPWGKSNRQERGRRAGTLAVPLIVGFASAIQLISFHEPIEKLRNILENKILNEIDWARRNGNLAFRLPHISSITFPGLDGERLFQQLTRVAVSNGSACTSAEVLPSHVLKAIGLSDADAESTVRLSLSRFTREEEIDFAAKHVVEVVHRLKKGF